MLQVCPCVRLHCGACGALLADPDDTSPHGGLATHYPTYEAALSAVMAAGWHGGTRGGRALPHLRTRPTPERSVCAGALRSLR
jgi:hypothetical protein